MEGPVFPGEGRPDYEHSVQSLRKNSASEPDHRPMGTVITGSEPLRVLMLEDNDDDADLIEIALKRGAIDFQCRRVTGKAAFRDALEGERLPDIILSDFTIPGFGGHQALAMKRTLAPDTPFVFVSGTIGEETAIYALKHGATDYVLKDNLSRLVPAVTRAMEEANERRARKEAEERVRENEDRFRLMVESVQDYAIFMLDLDGTVATWNAGAERISGYSADEIVGTHFSRFFSWQDVSDGKPRRQLEVAIAEGRSVDEGWRLRKDGSQFWAFVTVTIVRDAGGAQKGFAQVIRDVTERKVYEERILHLANHDPLTDLPNRNLLNDRLEQAMAHARRSGSLLAIMVLDLDQFKFVNDSFGHLTGDQLLRLASARLNAVIRDGDTVCRLGGDEFAILLTNLGGEQDVTRVAHKIVEAFSGPFMLEQEELFVTVSIGISLFPRDGDDSDVLLKAADTAMYRVKKQGRNDYMFHTRDMVEEVHEHVRMENALRKALSRGEFELHYQPQMELRGGRVIGVEALIRWQHPDHGLILPDRFIPLAEENGLIVPIGDWVLHTACAWSKSCEEHKLPPVYVAVNLSARQFTHESFARTIEKVLVDSSVNPHCLELELTETMMMDNADWLVSLLTRLRRMGLRMSVDDFGTGYSSLSYLKRFPIDRIKIDQMFVRDVSIDRDDVSICASIISLAHNLNLKAIAEGVESEDQLTLLAQCGCDEVQGYLVSRPLPAAECEAFLIARHAAMRPESGMTPRF